MRSDVHGIAVAAVLCATAWVSGCAQRDPGFDKVGDDVFKASTSYGWATSQDVGYIFTDGFTVQEVAKGPVTIRKVEPVMKGDALRLLGVKVRAVVGNGPFQHRPGWPPRSEGTDDIANVTDLADPEGFVVPAPGPTVGPQGRVWLNVLFGYEVLSEGRSTRRGAHVTYEIDGRNRTVFIGSYLAVCAPATMRCEQEDENGPVPLGPTQARSPSALEPYRDHAAGVDPGLHVGEAVADDLPAVR